MYATLYGQRTEVEPEERHFHRASDGIWHLRKSALPANEIMDAFEDLNLKCLQLLFESAEEFWYALEASNFNVIQAGLDPEALCSRDEFNDACKEMSSPLEKKLILLLLHSQLQSCRAEYYQSYPNRLGRCIWPSFRTKFTRERSPS